MPVWRRLTHDASIIGIPGWERELDLMELIRRQYESQGIETFPQYVELAHLHSLGYDITDPEVVEKARFMVEVREKHDEKRRAFDLLAPIPDGSVYYARMRDLIKIGTTNNVPRRMAQLMVDELLAVEPGGPDLEKLRLKQFKHLKHRGERFRAGDELLSHIDMLRRHYPNHQPA